MTRNPLIAELKAAVTRDLRRDRERAYRRALEHAGYTPGSVDLAVERDRAWIEKGR